MYHTDSTEEELEKLEQSVQYFSEHEKERNEMLESLQRIGKKDTSYYISPYMETLEVSKIGNITVYRILQILPICFLIGFLVSKNIFFAGFLAGNLILNIAVYAMMKMRYERHLAMLGTLNIILTIGKQLEKLNLEETFSKKLSQPLQVLKKAEGNIEKMQMPHTDIVTSMAVQDDIMSGDSYFIKEIKYLRRMFAHLNENRCTICIVDEILRGTNTKERIAASQTIMEYLCEKNCLVLQKQKKKQGFNVKTK